MKEQEWVASATVVPMLAHVRGKVSDRRLRLFACATARRAWPHLNENDRSAIEWAEGFADGGRGSSHSPELDAAGLKDIAWSACNIDAMAAARHVSTLAEGMGVSLSLQADILREVVGNPFRVPSGLFVVTRQAGQAPWLTRDVLAVATSIYESGDFDFCPVLADCLEEAGCDSEELLRHLRGWRRCTACLREGGRHSHVCECRATAGWLPAEKPPGCATHVRGCWALDLVLGKD